LADAAGIGQNYGTHVEVNMRLVWLKNNPKKDYPMDDEKIGRASEPNYLDQRRALRDLAGQLLRGEALLPVQSSYLGLAFLRIADGENANSVLSVSPRKGQTDAQAMSRQNLSIVMHWIAGAVAPEPVGYGYSVEKACQEAVPIAQKQFGDSTGEKYDALYLRKKWYEYQHMQSDTRLFYDKDFPYSS
jgi:hypothetical protein